VQSRIAGPVGMSSNSSGQALSMVVNVLNPELVVVGGDLAQAGDILLSPEPAACSTADADTGLDDRRRLIWRGPRLGSSAFTTAECTVARGSDLLILTKPRHDPPSRGCDGLDLCLSPT
jgi:hypothetical protein